MPSALPKILLVASIIIGLSKSRCILDYATVLPKSPARHRPFTCLVFYFVFQQNFFKKMENKSAKSFQIHIFYLKLKLKLRLDIKLRCKRKSLFH